MITKNYSISTSKINKSITICLFSDIHYTNTIKLSKLNEIKESIVNNKPDYICIPGDVIDNTNILDNSVKYFNLMNFLKEIGELAPVYISLGNHDTLKITNKTHQYDNNKFWNQDLTKYNINILKNEIKENKNIRFIGYNPSYNYYYNKEKKESLEILIKDFRKKIKEFDNKKLNILLCHSPINIINKELYNNINSYKNIDIILSGHMHNGMIPKAIDNIYPKNRGIIAPNRTLFPDNARGIKNIKIDNKEINLIISGGVNKIQKCAPKILQLGNVFFETQIEYIKINK